MNGLEQVIDPLPAAPPQISLLTSASPVRNPPDHWQAGLKWRPGRCLPEEDPTWWACVGDEGSLPTQLDPPRSKALADGPAIEAYQPWIAWTGDECTAARARAADFREAASDQLDACLSRILEDELWSGDVTQNGDFDNTYLSDPTGLDNLGTLGYVTALAELEQAIADGQCGPGMIHAQPRLVTLWTQNGLLVQSASGQQLRTVAKGTLVVPGDGYDGSGPGLAAGTAEESYAYASSIVRTIIDEELDLSADNGDGWQSPDQIASTNLVQWRAERIVAAFVQGCFRAGARVDLTTAQLTGS